MPTPSQPNAPDSTGASRAFATTCWTEVMAARGESSEARAALSELCENYYEPIVGYLRKAGRLGDGEARDQAHSFFAHLLAGGKLDRLERGESRFRSYLLGALKHFLSHERRKARAQKRGGGAEAAPVDDPDHCPAADPALPPDAWFDQQWAVALLDRALAAVESEFAGAGKAEQFRHLAPWLTGEAEHGDQAALAERAGIPANTLKSTVHRLRLRFRAAVKAEVARTLADGADIDAEMASLFAALGGG